MHAQTNGLLDPANRKRTQDVAVREEQNPATASPQLLDHPVNPGSDLLG